MVVRPAPRLSRLSSRLSRGSGLGLGLALVLAATSVSGCRGCRGRPPLFDGGAGDPVAVDPGTLAPDLRLEGGDEPKPVPPTTLKVSQERAPAWAVRGGYAPSLPDAEAEALYKELAAAPAAPAAMAEGTKGLLVCHFATTAQVKRGLTGLIGLPSNPVLRLEIEIVGLHVIVEAAGESSSLSFTVPLVELGPKSTFVIEALGTKVPLAATPRGTFAGKRAEHTVSCALMPHAEAEKRMLDALPGATRALRDAALDAHLITAKHRGFGQPALVSRVAGRTAALAALVGWADPRVEKRTEWGARIVRHHRAQVIELVDKWPVAGELAGIGELASAQPFPFCGPEERQAAASLSGPNARPAPCGVRVSVVPSGAPLLADVFFQRTTPALEGELVLDDGEVLLGAGVLPEGTAWKPVPDERNQRKLETGKGYLHVVFTEAFDRRDLRARPRALVLRQGDLSQLIPLGAAVTDAGGGAP